MCHPNIRSYMKSPSLTVTAPTPQANAAHTGAFLSTNSTASSHQDWSPLSKAKALTQNVSFQMRMISP